MLLVDNGIIVNAFVQTEIVQSSLEDDELRIQIRNVRKPPVEVLDVAASRLPVNSRVSYVYFLPDGLESLLYHVLPCHPIGYVPLVGRAA